MCASFQPFDSCPQTLLEVRGEPVVRTAQSEKQQDRRHGGAKRIAGVNEQCARIAILTISANTLSDPTSNPVGQPLPRDTLGRSLGVEDVHYRAVAGD